MLSHLLPYLLFVLPHSAADLLPAGVLTPAVRAWMDPLSVVLCGGSLVVFARRGAYPELRRSPAPRGALLLALGAGIAVALLWMPLTVIVPTGIGERAGFNPWLAGRESVPWLWASRIVGAVVVVPFAEELLVRSFLPRWTDAMDAWRERPVGAFTAASAGFSILFFTVTHPEWLAALVTAVIWTWLVARTRRLGDAVLAHAVANGALAAAWIATGDTSWW